MTAIPTILRTLLVHQVVRPGHEELVCDSLTRWHLWESHYLALVQGLMVVHCYGISARHVDTVFP